MTLTLGYPGEHQTKPNRCGNANPLRLDSDMFGVCVCVKPLSEAIKQAIQTPTTWVCLKIGYIPNEIAI